MTIEEELANELKEIEKKLGDMGGRNVTPQYVEDIKTMKRRVHQIYDENPDLELPSIIIPTFSIPVRRCNTTYRTL